MKILIRNALIFSPDSSHHLRRKDILVEDGQIREIGNISGTRAAEVVMEGKNLLASVPWFDLMAFFCEPGEEYKETLRSGAEAALFSGFQYVAVHGYSKAPVSHQGTVQKIKKFDYNGVQLLPVPCLTENYEGKHLPEMYDMILHGAMMFSDGHKSIQDEGLILRIIQYSVRTGAIPAFYPDTPALTSGGLMHEGVVSVSCGMKGMPSVAEEIFIEKLIRILNYNGGRAHLSCISTAESVSLVRKAKKKGLMLTCSVPVLNLIETHEALRNFDTNYKVLPPLRTEKDRLALIQGLEDGTIDAVVSNHRPQDTESKQLEFDYALPGYCTLPFFVPWYSSFVASESNFLKRIAEFPYQMMNVPVPVIEEKQPAELSIFDLEGEFILQPEQNPSRGVNASDFGKKMKGRCLATIKRNKLKKHV